MKLSPATQGLILAVLAAVGFAFKAILVKLAYAVPTSTPLDAITLIALRMLYALPFFAYIAWRESRSAAALPWRTHLIIAGLGLFGYYGASLFDFIGLLYISAGLERLVLATYPTLTLLIGVLFFKDKLSSRKLLACALCYTGIGAAFLHDLSFAGDSSAIIWGSLMVFISAVSYSLYLVGTGQMVASVSGLRLTGLALVYSTGITLAHFGLTHPATALMQPPKTQFLAMAMAMVSTVIPVFALTAAIKRLGAAQTALIGQSGPVLTLALGWWLLSEPFSIVQLAGLVLVLAGVTLISKQPKTT